jgi:hypothetical protein
MRFITTLLLLSIAVSSTAAVYKWKKPDGSIIYSDQPPSKDAAPADLPAVQEIKIVPPPSPSPEESTPKRSSEPRTVEYTTLEITSPANDSTIRDNAGNVSVNLDLEPALQEGDSVSVMLDGKEIGKGRGTSVALSNVDRGTHTLQAVVKSASNSTRISSPSIIFHLQRISISQEKRLTNPAQDTSAPK